MRDLISLLGGQRLPYFVTLTFAVMLGIAEAILHPLLIKAIFDSVLISQSLSQVILLGLAYFALGLSINVLSFFLKLWNMRIENMIVAEVSSDLLSSYFKKDYSKILKSGEGKYVSRIRADVKDGLVPALATFRNICVAIATFISLVAVLIFLSWQAFAILALIIPVATTISIVVSKKIREVTNRERDFEAGVLEVLAKAVSSFRLVNVFGLRTTVARRFQGSMKDVLDTGYQRFKLVNLLQGSSDLVMVISDSASMFVGAYLVFQKQMTIGSFIAFMNAFWRAATTLMSIFNQIAAFHNYSAIIARLVSFHKQDLSRKYWQNGNSVNADMLSFEFDENNPVFANFSFSLDLGERALVIGENGAGKSTLANILSGALAPLSGHVVLPEKISAVTLPVAFPPLRMTDLGIDPQLFGVLGLEKKSLAHATPTELSIGQQQKLALALALSVEADLYVFDEPLANLDTESRKSALELILARTRGKMLIMIMHDAEKYIDIFDKVVNLNKAPAKY